MIFRIFAVGKGVGNTSVGRVLQNNSGFLGRTARSYHQLNGPIEQNFSPVQFSSMLRVKVFGVKTVWERFGTNGGRPRRVGLK